MDFLTNSLWQVGVGNEQITMEYLLPVYLWVLINKLFSSLSKWVIWCAWACEVSAEQSQISWKEASVVFVHLSFITVQWHIRKQKLTSNLHCIPELCLLSFVTLVPKTQKKQLWEHHMDMEPLVLIVQWRRKTKSFRLSWVYASSWRSFQK